MRLRLLIVSLVLGFQALAQQKDLVEARRLLASGNYEKAKA